MSGGFLDRPHRPGAIGALMDLYASAAADLCEVVEQLAPERFAREVESEDPDTVSVHAICQHVVRATFGYANSIRKARGLVADRVPAEKGARVAKPADVRGLLAEGLRYTEGALDGLYDSGEQQIADLKFEVPWGPTYDPDMLLEHAIVHLLRHRRQILRWPV